MKIYVSGPITGIENKNKPSFDSTSEILRKLGHEVINPFDLDSPTFNPEECWFKYLKRDLAALLSCDSLCLLPGWEESKGACLEILVASKLNLPLFRLNSKNELEEEHIAVDTELTPLIPSYLWQ